MKNVSEGDEGKMEKRKDNRQKRIKKKRIFQRKRSKKRGEIEYKILEERNRQLQKVDGIKRIGKSKFNKVI